MKKLKAAYFGSPYFSAHLLEKLVLDTSSPVEITLVVTQPDKPVGKKQIITSSPVKLTAQKYKIPVWDKPIRAGNGFFYALPAGRHAWDTQKGGASTGAKNGNIRMDEVLKSVDFALVYAYGFKELIPLDLLKAPKLKIGNTDSGFVNIHPSLLPRYRGSSPIAFPLMMGDSKTGVTLFVMDEKMDHGPVVAQEKIKIALNDVRTNLEKKLTDLGFEMTRKLLILLSNDQRLTTNNQNHALATHAHFLQKQDGFVRLETLKKALKNEHLILADLPKIIQNYISRYEMLKQESQIDLKSRKHNKSVSSGFDLNYSGKVIYDFWRGMHPWPGVWTLIPATNQPPRLITYPQKRLRIIKMEYKENKLTITKVQLEGKKEVDFPTFQKAYGLL